MRCLAGALDIVDDGDVLAPHWCVRVDSPIELAERGAFQFDQQAGCNVLRNQGNVCSNVFPRASQHGLHNVSAVTRKVSQGDVQH